MPNGPSYRASLRLYHSRPSNSASGPSFVRCCPVISTGRRNTGGLLAINNDDGLPNARPIAFSASPATSYPTTQFSLPPSYHHEISDLSAYNRSFPSKIKCCIDRLSWLSNRDQNGAPRRTQRSATSGLMQCSKSDGYSMTSSAVVTSDDGTVRPSDLAVLRLITNSNLVDRMTGRSAGFSPLRTRPA